MYSPFNIGARFRITPPGNNPVEDERIPLVIAKGAFGSGEHETSASCLEILEELPQVQGARVLDLGSGTGILAIGALHLGAAQAVCIDINPDAVRTCRVNCEHNGVNERVTHVTGSLDFTKERDFDLILANIYGDLLVDFAPDLVSRARTGGLLLLSGILWEYNFEVRQLYEKLGCRVLKNRLLNEFSSVLLEKT
jgi:ribosomal protein L11 methyltransferase